VLPRRYRPPAAAELTENDEDDGKTRPPGGEEIEEGWTPGLGVGCLRGTNNLASREKHHFSGE